MSEKSYAIIRVGSQRGKKKRIGFVGGWKKDTIDTRVSMYKGFSMEKHSH